MAEVPPMSDPQPGPITRQQQAQMQAYAAGTMSGMAFMLQLLLGRPMPGGQPYIGVLPPGAIAWAEDALKRLRELGVPEAGGKPVIGNGQP